MLEHPFAELIIKTPSYEDAQHFYNENSYTAFTDAQHDAIMINDLETFTASGRNHHDHDDDYTPYFKFPLHRKRPHIYSPFHLYRPIVRCED